MVYTKLLHGDYKATNVTGGGTLWASKMGWSEMGFKPKIPALESTVTWWVILVMRLRLCASSVHLFLRRMKIMRMGCLHARYISISCLWYVQDVCPHDEGPSLHNKTKPTNGVRRWRDGVQVLCSGQVLPPLFVQLPTEITVVSLVFEISHVESNTGNT